MVGILSTLDPKVEKTSNSFGKARTGEELSFCGGLPRCFPF
jgi:hypothetical protein